MIAYAPAVVSIIVGLTRIAVVVASCAEQIVPRNRVNTNVRVLTELSKLFGIEFCNNRAEKLRFGINLRPSHQRQLRLGNQFAEIQPAGLVVRHTLGVRDLLISSNRLCIDIDVCLRAFLGSNLARRGIYRYGLCFCVITIDCAASEGNQTGGCNSAAVCQYDAVIFLAAERFYRNAASNRQLRFALRHSQQSQRITRYCCICCRCQRIVIRRIAVMLHKRIRQLLHTSSSGCINELMVESYPAAVIGTMFKCCGRCTGQHLIHHNGVDVVGFIVQMGNIIGRIALEFFSVRIQVRQTGILNQRAGRYDMRHNVIQSVVCTIHIALPFFCQRLSRSYRFRQIAAAANMVKADFCLRRILGDVVFQSHQVRILAEFAVAVRTGRLILAPGLHDDVVPVLRFDAHAQRIAVIGVIPGAILLIAGEAIRFRIICADRPICNALRISLQVPAVAAKVVVGDHRIRLAKSPCNVSHVTGQHAEIAVADQQDIQVLGIIHGDRGSSLRRNALLRSRRHRRNLDCQALCSRCARAECTVRNIASLLRQIQLRQPGRIVKGFCADFCQRGRKLHRSKDRHVCKHILADLGHTIADLHRGDHGLIGRPCRFTAGNHAGNNCGLFVKLIGRRRALHFDRQNVSGHAPLVAVNLAGRRQHICAVLFQPLLHGIGARQERRIGKSGIDFPISPGCKRSFGHRRNAVCNMNRLKRLQRSKCIRADRGNIRLYQKRFNFKAAPRSIRSAGIIPNCAAAKHSQGLAVLVIRPERLRRVRSHAACAHVRMCNNIRVSGAFLGERCVCSGIFRHMHTDISTGRCIGDVSSRILACKRNTRHVRIEKIDAVCRTGVPEADFVHLAAHRNRRTIVARANNRTADFRYAVWNMNLDVASRHICHGIKQIPADFGQTVSKDDFLDFGCMDTGVVLGKRLTIGFIPRERSVVALISIDPGHLRIFAGVCRINGNNAILAHFRRNGGIADICVVIQIFRLRKRHTAGRIYLYKCTVRNRYASSNRHIFLLDLQQVCKGIFADAGYATVNGDFLYIAAGPRRFRGRRIIPDCAIPLDGQRLAIRVIQVEHIRAVRSHTAGTHIGMGLDRIIARSQLVVSLGAFLDMDGIVKAVADVSRGTIRRVPALLLNGDAGHFSVQNIYILRNISLTVERRADVRCADRNDDFRIAFRIAQNECSDILYAVRNLKLNRGRGHIGRTVEQIAARSGKAVRPDDLCQILLILSSATPIVEFAIRIHIGFIALVIEHIKPRETGVIAMPAIHTGHNGIVAGAIGGIGGQNAILRHPGRDIRIADVFVEILIFGRGQLETAQRIAVGIARIAVTLQPGFKGAALAVSERDLVDLRSEGIFGILGNCNTGRNGNVVHLGQTCKGILANVLYAGDQNDLRDPICIGVPRSSSNIGIVLHNAAAVAHGRNGQRIAINHPDHLGGVVRICAAGADGIYFLEVHIGDAALACQGRILCDIHRGHIAARCKARSAAGNHNRRIPQHIHRGGGAKLAGSKRGHAGRNGNIANAQAHKGRLTHLLQRVRQMDLQILTERCTGNIRSALIVERILANLCNAVAKADRGKCLARPLGIPGTKCNAGIGRRIEHVIVLVVRHQCAFTADQHFAAVYLRGEIRAAGARICLECNTLAPFIRRVDMDNRLQAICKIFGNQAICACIVDNRYFVRLALGVVNVSIESADCFRLLLICNFTARCAVIIAFVIFPVISYDCIRSLCIRYPYCRWHK